MIHVEEQPEPVSFDIEVRQKGLSWIAKNNIDINIAQSKIKLPPYWRACLNDLYRQYNGYCAYLAVFFEITTGAGTVDHFVPKSKNISLAYEWSNYRLSCSRINSRKRDYDDVLDPFKIEDGLFHLEFVSGRIYPNPKLSDTKKVRVQQTIDRLGLDDPMNREMRARHFQGYCEKLYSAEHLKKISPFVWMEAERQNLL